MLKTPLSRWLITRELYIYIYRVGSGLARSKKIKSGVTVDDFVEYLWGKWIGFEYDEKYIVPKTGIRRTKHKIFFWLRGRKKVEDYISSIKKSLVYDCIDIDYIKKMDADENDTRIQVGRRGMEIYSWYYPLVAPLMTTLGKGIILALITIYVTNYVKNTVTESITEIVQAPQQEQIPHSDILENNEQQPQTDIPTTTP